MSDKNTQSLQMNRADFKPSLVRSLWIYFTSFGAYIGLFHASFMVRAEPLAWAFSFLNGILLLRLASIMHDTAHQSFFPKGNLNTVLGRLLFLTIYMPFTAWCYEHHTQHHRYTNWAQKDITWNPFSYTEFKLLSSWRQMLERIYRTPFGTGFYWIAEFWWKRHIAPRKYIEEEMKSKGLWKSHRFDIFGVFCFLVTQCLYVLFLSLVSNKPYFYMLFITVALPHFIFTWIVGFLIYFQHNSPDVPWYKSENEWKRFANQGLLSTHVILPAFLDLFLNVNVHSAHHVNMNIPGYHLLERQAQLVNYFGGRVPVYSFSIAWVKNLFHKCKLYDFDNHRWLDFEGNPTTPPIDLARFAESSIRQAT